MERDYTLCYREKCSALSLWTCEHNFKSINIADQRAKQLGNSMVTMIIPFFKSTPVWMRDWRIKLYLYSQIDISHRNNPYDNE